MNRVLRLGSSDEDRELSVGYMFCRPQFQDVALSNLPFIKWDSRETKNSRNAETEWLQNTMFGCEEYVLLEHLVTLPPLHDVVAVVGKELPMEKRAMLAALGAKVQVNLSGNATHFILTTADGTDKRLSEALNRGLTCVTADWIDRYEFTTPREYS